MIRCTSCKKDIIPLTKDSDWMGLWFFLEFLLEEGYIEKATYETQTERLMTFKAWAMGWNKEDQCQNVVS